MLNGKTIERYEICSRIGAGGMGEIYLAHDEQMNRLVALKILPVETSGDQLSKQRFKQEARHVSALNHPNIITIYEVGDSADGWFIAAEYVEGETLRQVMKNPGLKSCRR